MNTGIPTMYEDVLFRSRLEARWAAFFDKLGWKWEYEPFDLAGWIPDFLLLGATKVLVEVKPVVEYPEAVMAKMEKGVAGTEWQKPAEDWWDADKELLIVGATLPPVYGCGSLGLGWFPHGHASFSKGKQGWDFHHAINSYHHRISGEYDGDNHFHKADEEEVQRLWKEAANDVQWRGAKNKADAKTKRAVNKAKRARTAKHKVDDDERKRAWLATIPKVDP